jgi:Fe-S oxidoreductase
MKAPPLIPHVSANVHAHRAKRELLEPLGLPPPLPADWRDRALNKFDELLHQRRSLRLSLDICVRCGACADKCPFLLGTGDPNNMPVARAELLRKVYRRYFTTAGKLAGRLAAAEDLTETVLDEWFTYFYQCSECRRCAVFCPFGVDTAELTMAAREILAAIGLAPKYTAEVIKKVHDVGNNLGIPEAAWLDTCQFLEEELKEQTGQDINIPVNQAGAEVLLVPPSADAFANTDTMMGYAKFFHAAGISWTTSTYASEAGNFGLFFSYEQMQKINRRLVESARALRVKRLVLGECGHAWRAAQAFMDTFNGPLDFLEKPCPQHICELAARAIREGRLKLDKTANSSMSVTYHDPCNLARGGGLTEEPREILRAVVNDYREMPADTIREKTFCCGGGGGLLTEELMDTRMKGAKPRVEAFRSTGATHLVTPCAICKAQLPVAFKHHGVDAQVAGVMDLLGRAIVLEK